jgi:mono/diheme cytochrome c family protein
VYKIGAMRRTALGLATLLAVIGIAAAGCGGEEEASPSPETVSGTLSTSTSTTTTTTESTTTTGQTGSSSSSSTTTTGTTGQGNAAAGKAVFTGSAGCTNCHTLADAGSTGTVGPNLDDAKPPYALVIDRVTNGKSVMPPFKGTLTPTQIQDVAAYVSSVAGK